MFYKIDVAIPSRSINILTYKCTENLSPGTRVVVELRKELCVGFVLGPSQRELSSTIKIKPVIRIIDREGVICPDLWDLAKWSGREDLCGIGVSLASIFPQNFLDGETVIAQPRLTSTANKFREINFYYPYDHERIDFFLTELRKQERTIILFPLKESAEKFFLSLPSELKQESLLWPSIGGKKLWEAWNSALTHQVRIIIGSQGGIFAPLSPEKIIIEDEANGAYIFQRAPRISARDLARHRAEFLGAKIITAGRMPSLSVYLRTKPRESSLIPKKENIILADINYSHEEKARGVDGNINLNFALMKRTYKELSCGNNVIWILNRLGNSLEVFCENCGESIKCEKCGNIMRSEALGPTTAGGTVLKCKCGHVKEIPESCPVCGYKLFKGRRPGLEALYEIVKKYYNNVSIYIRGTEINPQGLILATNGVLELCGKINPSLIAWLDLDSELLRPDYETQYRVFSALWDSYWRGRKQDDKRKILIQARVSAMKFAEKLSWGWEKFLLQELKTREEFFLPPYSHIINIECKSNKTREEIVNIFMDGGFFVMDSGTYKIPLQVCTDSIEKIRDFIENNSVIQKVLKKSIKITVRRD